MPADPTLSPASPPAFREVADRVWVLRHPWFDVNLTCIGGSRGLLLVDTHASEAAGRALVDRARELGAGDVVAVVNTHEHHDHVLGNTAVREAFPDAPLHAHEECAARMAAAVAAEQEGYARARAHEERAAEIVASRVVVPDQTFSSAAVVDLGDRTVELVHPGRGHTAGDVVVRVPDADVLLAGDLVEESAPPAYGPDSFPLEWPRALDLALQLIGPDTVVVPGHGGLVGLAFVRDQRADIGVVAETIRDLASRGVPVGQALQAVEWPFPRELLAEAVRRGYAQLPREGRGLPLL